MIENGSRSWRTNPSSGRAPGRSPVRSAGRDRHRLTLPSLPTSPCPAPLVERAKVCQAIRRRAGPKRAAACPGPATDVPHMGEGDEVAAVDDLLDRVPGWAGRPRTVTPLEGGITNRNFRVDVDGESFVARAPGKDTDLLGIDRRPRAGGGAAGRRPRHRPRGRGLRRARRLADHPVRRGRTRRRRLTAPAPVGRPLRPSCAASTSRRRSPPSSTGTACPRTTRRRPRARGVDVPDAYDRAMVVAERVRARLRPGRRGTVSRATTTCCRPTSWTSPTAASACSTGSTPG